MNKKPSFLIMLAGILAFGFVCIGCTSVSGNVESAFSFSTPIPVEHLIVGSFTYDINDSYTKLPDGSLVLTSTINERNFPDLYEEIEEIFFVTDSSGNRVERTRTRTRLKDNIITNSSYDELYSWAIQRAAENGGIAKIIAIKSFITTTTTNVMGMSRARQSVTITVYGEGNTSTLQN